VDSVGFMRGQRLSVLREASLFDVEENGSIKIGI
jgi:hypothetical protein